MIMKQLYHLCALVALLSLLLRLTAYEEDRQEGYEGPEVMKLFHDHILLEIIISD